MRKRASSRKLAEVHSRGYRRLTAYLRRKGRRVNHKRVYRLYELLGLSLPKPKLGSWGENQTREALAGFEPSSSKELEKELLNWMRFYNESRPHSTKGSLGGGLKMWSWGYYRRGSRKKGEGDYAFNL